MNWSIPRPVAARWMTPFVVLSVLANMFVAPQLAAQGDQPTSAEREVTVSSVERERNSGVVTANVILPLEQSPDAVDADSVSLIVGTTEQDVSLTRITNDDLQVMLVIDVSGSMAGPPLEAAQEAASSFVLALPDVVDVGVIAFDETARTVSALSAGRDEALDAIAGLKVGGETALFDAIVLAESEFSKDDSTRRVIVALSDGGDTVSTSPLAAARSVLLDADIESTAVALATSESETDNLQALVNGSAGRLIRIDDSSSLVSIYDDVASELVSRFAISFTPETSGAGEALLLINAGDVIAGTSFRFDSVNDGGARSVVVKDAVVAAAPGAATTATPNTPIANQVTAPRWVATAMARNLGVGAIAIMLLLVGLLISFPTHQVSLLDTRRRRGDVATLGGTPGVPTRVVDVTERLHGLADRFLRRDGRDRRLSRALERAGLALRPAEFVVMVVAGSLVVAMLLGLFWGVLPAVIWLPVSFFFARWTVGFRGRQRSAKFVDQLPATIQLLSGGLRAGFALPQAMEHVANETMAPTSDEFHRLSTEVRLGRDLGESLEAMASRLDSQDFEWLVKAIQIHREVGGDLADVLDKIYLTIQDRNFIRRQISAMSAEGRYSAYLITTLPFVVVVLLAFTNPEYIGRLIEGPRGFLIIAVAILLISLGALWMRAIMKVRF